MNDKKANPDTNITVSQYYKSRRMFCIYKKKLIIAERNLDYSHSEWFKKNNWKYQDKDLIDEIARGFIDETGDVYFYTGKDYRITDKIRETFFANLKELALKLKLKANAQIYGGLINYAPTEKLIPIKKYGTIKDNLAHNPESK